jgi:alkylation response protein AidB-like acyl-CoA dehydrogenase
LFNQSPLWYCLGAVGAAMDCYDIALNYSKERIHYKSIGLPVTAEKTG